MSFSVDECCGCGHRVHPARYLCPQCHGAAWRARPVRSASLLQATQLAGARGGSGWIATLRTDAGPLVVARLEQAPDERHPHYALRVVDGALVATAAPAPR